MALFTSQDASYWDDKPLKEIGIDPNTIHSGGARCRQGDGQGGQGLQGEGVRGQGGEGHAQRGAAADDEGEDQAGVRHQGPEGKVATWL